MLNALPKIPDEPPSSLPLSVEPPRNLSIASGNLRALSTPFITDFLKFPHILLQGYISIFLSISIIITSQFIGYRFIVLKPIIYP